MIGGVDGSCVSARSWIIAIGAVLNNAHGVAGRVRSLSLETKGAENDLVEGPAASWLKSQPLSREVWGFVTTCGTATD